MVENQVKERVQALTRDIIQTTEKHMKEAGLRLDRDSLLNATLPMIELVAETAYFESSDFLERHC